jgi:hypothetical protein
MLNGINNSTSLFITKRASLLGIREETRNTSNT